MQTPELEHRGFTKHGNQCMIILSSLVKDLPLDLQYSSNYKRFFSIQSEPSLDFAVQINFGDTTTPLSDLRYTLYFLISSSVQYFFKRYCTFSGCLYKFLFVLHVYAFWIVLWVIHLCVYIVWYDPAPLY